MVNSNLKSIDTNAAFDRLKRASDIVGAFTRLGFLSLGISIFSKNIDINRLLEGEISPNFAVIIPAILLFFYLSAMVYIYSMAVLEDISIYIGRFWKGYEFINFFIFAIFYIGFNFMLFGMIYFSVPDFFSIITGR